MAYRCTAIVLILFATTSALAEHVFYPGYGTHLAERKGEVIPIKAVENVPFHNYEYHVIPKKDLIITEYEHEGSSLSGDITALFNPITAIGHIASCALSTGVWILSNMGFIIFGAVSVVALCAFTPYCDLVIKSPIVSHMNIPYLDEIECYFREAYEKYYKK